MTKSAVATPSVLVRCGRVGRKGDADSEAIETLETVLSGHTGEIVCRKCDADSEAIETTGLRLSKAMPLTRCRKGDADSEAIETVFFHATSGAELS